MKCRFCDEVFVMHEDLRKHQSRCEKDYLAKKDWLCGEKENMCFNCEGDLEHDHLEYRLPQGIFAEYRTVSFSFGYFYYGNTYEGCCSEGCLEAINHYVEEYLIKEKLIAYDDKVEMWYWIKKREQVRIYMHDLVKFQKIFEDVLSGKIDDELIKKYLEKTKKYVEKRIKL